ncbi:MAG: radical SAM protein [Bacteroidota bacterium]
MSGKFTQAVIKVASRCNLNCSYCYVYNRGDTTYLKQPKFMPKPVINKTIERIYNHVMKHKLDRFHFIFHGGEPLLAKPDFFENFVQEVYYKFRKTKVKTFFSVQTNGLLINDEWCDLFARHGFNVGISLDGNKEANDEFRVDHQGKGSYDRVLKGVDFLKRHKKVRDQWGIISVMNPNMDAIEVYNHYKSIGTRAINFLFPDCTHDDKYAVIPPDSDVFATWLIKMFDRWFYESPKERPDIQMFSSLISVILGGGSWVEHFGKGNSEIVVIESNGSIEAEDSLRGCGNGFTKAGANVMFDELDDAFDTKLAYLYHNGSMMNCTQCMACPLNEICSGGFLLHRYDSKTGFNNPSVYCDTLMKLITHIQKIVLDNLPKSLLEEAGVSYITYEETKEILAEELPKIKPPEHISFLESFKSSEYLVKDAV